MPFLPATGEIQCRILPPAAGGFRNARAHLGRTSRVGRFARTPRRVRLTGQELVGRWRRTRLIGGRGEDLASDAGVVMSDARLGAEVDDTAVGCRFMAGR